MPAPPEPNPPPPATFDDAWPRPDRARTPDLPRRSGLAPSTPIDGAIDTVDYNDIRIAGGLEFKTVRSFTGHIEIGLACSRELVYLSREPSAYYPTNTVYIGAGMSY